MRTEGQEVKGESLTRADILSKIRDILSGLVDDDELQLDESTTAEDVPSWDSINHVKLIVALESDLHIRFATDEINSVQNVGELITIIQRKL